MMPDFIYGVHAVAQLLQQPNQVKQIWLLAATKNQRLQALAEQAKQAKIRCQWVDRKQLEKLVGSVSHQGVVASYQLQMKYHEQDLPSLLEAATKPLVLVLDGIQDPHNLGACLRTADACGVTAVIIPRDKSVGLTPTVSKVACGAVETVPLIAVTNLVRTLNYLKQCNLWIIGTSDNTDKNLYTLDLDIPLALVMGAEGKGLRRLTQVACDHVVAIPMQGAVTSLNISVATGVCLFEVLRQQLFT